MGNLKIELKVEELEKLFGTMTTGSLELKQWVVEEFARRHIKSLMNDDLIRKIKSELDSGTDLEIKKAVSEVLGVKKSSLYPYGYFVSQETKAIIKQQVNSIIKEVVSEAVAQYDIGSYIKSLVGPEIQRQAKILFDQRIAQVAKGVF